MTHVVTGSTPDEARPEKRKAPKRSLARDALSLGAFLATALTARASLADHYVVPTGSMIPTVREGDRVFVSKAAYGLRIPLSRTWLVRWADLHRGDVVVLDSPDDDQVLLKRVVALPGDRVEVREGHVTIAGQRIETTDHDETLGGKRHLSRSRPAVGPTWDRSSSLLGRSSSWETTEATAATAARSGSWTRRRSSAARWPCTRAAGHSDGMRSRGKVGKGSGGAPDERGFASHASPAERF